MLGRLGEKTGGGGGESSQRRDDATVGNDDANNTSGGSAVSDGKCSGLIAVLHATSHIKVPHTVHFLLLAKIHKSPTWTGPGGKLSYRSAIHQKVRLFAGSVCPWPQGQAEVGRDQEHPGNTSHGPNKLKFGQTYYFYISKNRA